MTFIFRNMWRRKGRTFLTIFGIVVGIFALTVLGGMTARMNQQINGMKGFIADKITIAPASAGSHMGMALGSMKMIEMSKIPEIEKVPGVKGASGVIMVQLKASEGMSQPQMMIGYQPVAGTSMFNNVKMSAGRELQPGDSGKVLLGSTLAKDMNAKGQGADVNTLGWFTSVGLTNADGTPKPALAAWDGFRSKP